jgi:hypothetical protein
MPLLQELQGVTSPDTALVYRIGHCGWSTTSRYCDHKNSPEIRIDEVDAQVFDLFAQQRLDNLEKLIASTTNLDNQMPR